MYSNTPEIIPAFRLLFSGEKLLSARALPEEISKKIVSEESSINKELPVTTDDLLILDKSQYSLQGLKQIANTWKSAHTSPPKVVLLKDQGAFTLGKSAAGISCFINNQEDSHIPELQGSQLETCAAEYKGLQDCYRKHQQKEMPWRFKVQ